MPSDDPGHPAGPRPGGEPSLISAIDGLLQRLPPELVQGIRLGAVPHRFDAELLGALSGGAADPAALLDEMRRLGLVAETASGWLIYHDILRGHLLAALHSRPEVYRRASVKAAEYFAARRAGPGSPNPDADLLEYLYHQLAADETAGLPLLHRHFEELLRGGKRGLAERLLDYAAEQQPVLSPAGHDWLRYLRARLAPAAAGPEKVQPILAELATGASDPLLRALARRGLGEALAGSRQWAKGLRELHAALGAFLQLDDTREVANTQAALGLVYVGLAEAAGGLRDESPPLESRAERWFYVLEHAPFLLYQWLSRRFRFVPNVYFGSDYQNWIIVRYLYGAMHWFRRAERTLGRVDTQGEGARSVARTNVRIRLADLKHRVGRWALAERDLAALARDPNVRASPYLSALVHLGQGRALVARGRLQPALDTLRACGAAFRQYTDLNNAGQADRLIGQALARLHRPDEALYAYQAAAAEFYSTDNLLNGTDALVEAGALADRLPAGEAEGLRAGLAGQFPRQAYMERFPDGPSGFLHRFFRGFATFLMLPLGGLLIILLLFVAVLWSGAFERFFSSGLMAVPLPALLLLPLFALWTYEALYAVAGVLVARLLPFEWITRHQPVYLILDQQGLGQYDESGSLVKAMTWPEVSLTASLDRSVWRTPLTLFSRFFIGSQKQDNELAVDGILNHYVPFKREVGSRVRAQPQPARQVSLDFSLLDRRWLVETLIVTVLLVGISILADPQQVPLSGIEAGGHQFSLLVAGVALRLWQMVIFVGPLFVLVELLRNRRAARRLLGNRVRRGLDWPIWLAVLVLLASTILQFLTLTLTPD